MSVNKSTPDTMAALKNLFFKIHTTMYLKEIHALHIINSVKIYKLVSVTNFIARQFLARVICIFGVSPMTSNPASTRLCFFRKAAQVNSFIEMSHWNGFSVVCVSDSTAVGFQNKQMVYDKWCTD